MNDQKQSGKVVENEITYEEKRYEQLQKLMEEKQKTAFDDFKGPPRWKLGLLTMWFVNKRFHRSKYKAFSQPVRILSIIFWAIVIIGGLLLFIRYAP